MALAFDAEAIALPQGAWARTHRRYVTRDGRPLIALTSGEYRPYVYPLATPSGVAVTSEAPADHPHHHSLWIGADHVHAQVPASEGRVEEYTYNFYLDEVFQGRAPGRIVETGVRFAARGDDGATIVQSLEWRGPVEWAAPQGRSILAEVRTTTIAVERDATLVHQRSRLAPVTWPVRLGPTRHAYFNVRVAETMQAVFGGRILDDRGATIGATQTPSARWIDYVGPVGGGREAGVALVPLTDVDDGWWFVADWGVVTWGPFRRTARALALGESLSLESCVIAHDGDIGPARLAELRDRIVERARRSR
ncbi:MAG: PmoA family protein [Burkholderiales bacterium]|nr:PmoA family protein [Burkholderiales bacterium]